MRVNASWNIAIISAMALAAGACKGGPGDLGTTGPTGPTGPAGPMLPSPTWVSPGDGQGSVPLDGVVRVAFNKDMDPATIAAANFQLSAGAAPVAATISYNPGSRTAFLAPSAPLASFAAYTATLTTGVRDAQGNALASAFTWSFTTSGSFSRSSLYLGCWNTNVAVFNSPTALSGTQVPDRSIPVTNVEKVWLDSMGDRLYVSQGQSNAWLVLNNGSFANGAVTPARTITGASSGISGSRGIWLDPVSDSLYAANVGTPSITVHGPASTVNGNVAPLRTISGAATTLNYPWSLWLDPLSDDLYVSNEGASSILVFAGASTANGNVAPARTIAGLATTLLAPEEIFLDKASDRLYVADPSASNIVVFDNASTANGNVAPARVIATGGSPSAVWLDAATDRLFVGDTLGHVWIYDGASTLTGTPTPTRTINTCQAWFLFFDPGS